MPRLLWWDIYDWWNGKILQNYDHSDDGNDDNDNDFEIQVSYNEAEDFDTI